MPMATFVLKSGDQWPMRSGPHFPIHINRPTGRIMGNRQTPKFRWDEFDGGHFLLRFDHGFADVILGNYRIWPIPPQQGCFRASCPTQRTTIRLQSVRLDWTACAHVQILTRRHQGIPQRHAILCAIHIDFKAALFGPPRRATTNSVSINAMRL